MTNRQIRTAPVLMAAILGSCLLVGCKSSAHHAGNIKSIRKHPTPELATLAERPADRKNLRAYVLNTNYRMIGDDFRRALMTSRPSRLTTFAAP